jgi:hypothetical protein
MAAGATLAVRDGARPRLSRGRVAPAWCDLADLPDIKQPGLAGAHTAGHGQALFHCIPPTPRDLLGL